MVTGNNALIGINRDLNKAVQITRDYQKNTQLYLSSSSIDAAANLQETWGEWKVDLSAYVSRSANGFKMMGALAEKAKYQEIDPNNKFLSYSIQILGWIPRILVGTGNYLDKPHSRMPPIGIIPSVNNDGGIATQFSLY